MAGPWEHDWRLYLSERLKVLGHPSLRSFAREYPLATFFQLSDELGGGLLAPVQIQQILKEEAEAYGDWSEYLRDSLFRFLKHDVPNGIRSHGEWPLTLALSTWVSSAPPALVPRCRRIAKSIKKLSPELDAWIPSLPLDQKLDEILRNEGLY